MLRIKYCKINTSESRPNRRVAERAAVKSCLSRLGHDPEYEHDPDGKPFFGDSHPAVRLSVSHCRHWAAVCVGTDDDGPFGIDIEHSNRAQLLRVLPRILSETELSAALKTPLGPVKAWTAKEALYKAAGFKVLDFASDIMLEPPAFNRATVKGHPCIFILDYFYPDDETLMCVAHIHNNLQEITL